jgi:hypothetical protein
MNPKTNPYHLHAEFYGQQPLRLLVLTYLLGILRIDIKDATSRMLCWLFANDNHIHAEMMSVLLHQLAAELAFYVTHNMHQT